MLLTGPQLVAQIRPNILEVSCAELAEHKNDYLLIDIREANEINQGYIADASFITRSLLEFKIAQLGEGTSMQSKLESLSDRNICLYCKSDGRSTLAAEQLQRLGFTRVYSLTGGFDGWQAAGFEVTHDH